MIGIASTQLPVPGRESLRYMAREAANYVLLPEHPEALEFARSAINQAIREINSRSWKWARATFHFGLEENVRIYDQVLPPDFKNLIDGRYLDVNLTPTTDQIEYVDPQNFRLRWAKPENGGTPIEFTVRLQHGTTGIGGATAGHVVEFDRPLTAAAISRNPYFELFYYFRLPVLKDWDDVLRAPSEIGGLIVAHAKTEMAANYDRSKYQAAERIRMRLWDQLRIDDNFSDDRES